VLIYVGTIHFQKVSKKSTGIVVLQEDVIGSLLTHASDTVRSLAFSVLVSSPSSTRPFSLMALDILKSNMGILYADTDAKFRNEVLSHTKHMIERLRGAIAFLMRDIGNIHLSLNSDQISSAPLDQHRNLLDSATELLRGHKAFVRWLVEFLTGELIPTSSYQRHITALKAVSILLRSGILEQHLVASPAQTGGNPTIWPYSIKFFTQGTLRLLLDLLMDPFEDVRSIAAVVLKLATPSVFELGSHLGHIRHRSLGLLMDFIERAKDVSKRTGRADYADGVARSYELLFSLLSSAETRIGLFEDLVDDLELKVEIAEQDLTKAVLNAPIHGSFAALK